MLEHGISAAALPARSALLLAYWYSGHDMLTTGAFPPAVRTGGETMSGLAHDVKVRAMISSAPILSIHADLADILHLGHTPRGERRLVGILGGRVDGPRLRGHILPGGADWQIVRPDGVAEISARYAVEAESGARVLVESKGLRHGPPDVMERLARDEGVEASAYYFRTVMRFETADLSLDWLNRIIAVARGARRPRGVSLEVFEVL